MHDTMGVDVYLDIWKSRSHERIPEHDAQKRIT